MQSGACQGQRRSDIIYSSSTSEGEAERCTVQAQDPHSQMECQPHFSIMCTSFPLASVSTATTLLNRGEHLVSKGKHHALCQMAKVPERGRALSCVAMSISRSTQGLGKS